MSRKSKKWNEFLADLWDKLSAYEIQEDKAKYNVADIEYWGESGHEQGIEVTKNDFELFLNKTAQYDITEYDYVKNTTITDSQLSELNHILSLTLKAKASKACPTSNELVVKGDYVKFSDFVNEDGSLNPSDECNDITVVNVFALNTVFIDRNVNLVNERMNFNVISPKWEIVSSRVIELSGIAGGSKYFTVFTAGDDGRDGEPGLPGGPGGNFFGIAAKFVNGENLTIISKGGNGGPGGNGENGEDGMNGYIAVVVDSRRDCSSSSYGCTDGRGFIGSDKTEWPNCQRTYFFYEFHLFIPDSCRCRYEIPGIPGKRGGHGGDGGKAGKGGNPGKLVLFELNGTSGISMHYETGKDGENGAGGEGGEAGFDGNKMRITYWDTDGWEHQHTFQKQKSKERGKDGVDGINDRGMQYPETPTLPAQAKILNAYKNYLRKNLNDSSRRHSLMEFVRQVDNDDNAKGVYDTLELFNELNDLEEQFHYFNDDVDLASIYELLLNRISEYALNSIDIKSSSRYKKILIHLYTATLGRIYYLKDHSEFNLIVDIDKHINMIERGIEGVRNIEITSARDNFINIYEENFKRNIQRDMDEARYAIERQIQTEIDDASHRNEKQIDKLLNERRPLRNLTEIDQQHLIKSNDHLKRARKLRVLFERLNFSGQDIRDIMTPMLQTFDYFVSSNDNEMWAPRREFERVESEVKNVAEIFDDVNDDMPYCVRMLLDTITALINVCDEIEKCKRSRKFVDSFVGASNIIESDVDIIDLRQRYSVNEDYLVKLIRSDYTVLRRKTAIEAFKNFVFPLAHEYLQDSVLTSYLLLGSDLEELLTETTMRMENIKSWIDDYRTYLNGTGQNAYIKLAPFESGYTSTRPFFVWENLQNRDVISKLLSGQRVNVTANVNKSPAHKDAIKFSVAEFYFKARNETMQTEVNEVLDGFEIEARHLGDSYYRCNDKIYKITSNVTVISYYLEKGTDGEPISKNPTYVDLKKSQSILSPYATWEIVMMETGDSYAFRDLDKYKYDVDLELIGHGSYIDNRKVDYSNLKIDNYYREIDIYNGIKSKSGTSGETSKRRYVRSADAPDDNRSTSDVTLESFSPINYVGHFFKDCVSKIKCPSAVGRIKNWFRNQSIGVDKVTFDEIDSSYDDRHSFDSNRDSAYIELPDSTAEPSLNKLIDTENHSSGVVDYDSLKNHGNLLLLDLLLRKTNATKHKNYDNTIRDNADPAYAQNLAYSAYAPGNESSDNTSYSLNP